MFCDALAGNLLGDFLSSVIGSFLESPQLTDLEPVPLKLRVTRCYLSLRWGCLSKQMYHLGVWIRR